MSKGAREKFYKSKTWKATREAFLKSKGRLCERCLNAGMYVPAVIVHHKIYLDDDKLGDPRVSLDWCNLEALCRDCHAAEHKKQKRFIVDEFGRVTGRPPRGAV